MEDPSALRAIGTVIVRRLLPVVTVASQPLQTSV